MTCTRPPLGWYCPKEEGHDGPCPTYPLTSLAFEEGYEQGLLEHKRNRRERIMFLIVATLFAGLVGWVIPFDRFGYFLGMSVMGLILITEEALFPKEER